LVFPLPVKNFKETEISMTRLPGIARLSPPQPLVVLPIGIHHPSGGGPRQPDTVEQHLPRKRGRSESAKGSEAPPPEKRGRYSIASLLNEPPPIPRSNAVYALIEPPTIPRQELCKKLTSQSLGDLIVDLFNHQAVDNLNTEKNKNKIGYSRYIVNCLVETIQRQSSRAIDSQEWSHVCHEKYEESVIEAQGENSNWKHKTKSEKSTAIYLILTKKIENYLTEVIFSIEEPITQKKINNNRNKKNSAICVLAKIIVTQAMGLSGTQAAYDLLSMKNNLCLDTIADTNKKNREAKIKILKDPREIIFSQKIVEMSLAGGNLRESQDAKYYLHIALAYDNLPEQEKPYPSFLQLISRHAPALLETPADQRETPSQCKNVMKLMPLASKSPDVVFLRMCIRNDAVLKKAIELSTVD
jgi:hypothetical protein